MQSTKDLLLYTAAANPVPNYLLSPARTSTGKGAKGGPNRSGQAPNQPGSSDSRPSWGGKNPKNSGGKPSSGGKGHSVNTGKGTRQLSKNEVAKEGQGVEFDNFETFECTRAGWKSKAALTPGSAENEAVQQQLIDIPPDHVKKLLRQHFAATKRELDNQFSTMDPLKGSMRKNDGRGVASKTFNLVQTGTFPGGKTGDVNAPQATAAPSQTGVVGYFDI